MEHGIAGLIVEIANQHGHERMLHRRGRHGPSSDNVRAGEEREHDDERRRQHALAEPRRLRNQLARIVERGERRRQLGRRLVTRRRIALEAAADDRGQRLGNRLIDRAQEGKTLLEPLPHRGDAILRRSRRIGPRADEHLVQDQPERVEVGARVHRPASRLFG